MAVPVPPIDTGHAHSETRRRHRRHHEGRNPVTAQAAILAGGPDPDDRHTRGHAGQFQDKVEL